MTIESTSTVAATAADKAVSSTGTDAIQVLRTSMLQTLRRNGWSTLKYLGTTEVHTYAFSVAANAILSFMPATVLMLTVSRNVFHSPAMYRSVQEMIKAFLPLEQGRIAGWIVLQAQSHTIKLFSLVMLFISCTGVFEPLEVALNSVWGFKSRNYLMNQLVSLGLAFGCGVLAFASAAATAGVWAPTHEAQFWLANHIGTSAAALFVLKGVSGLNMTVQYVAMKSFGMIASVLIFFLIYWLLPNGKINPRAVLPAAITTGVAFEVAQLIFMAVVPYMDFAGTYGPFHVSVTLIFWSFFVGLLLLGGAHLSAQDAKTARKQSLMTPAPELQEVRD